MKFFWEFSGGNENHRVHSTTLLGCWTGSYWQVSQFLLRVGPWRSPLLEAPSAGTGGHWGSIAGQMMCLVHKSGEEKWVENNGVWWSQKDRMSKGQTNEKVYFGEVGWLLSRDWSALIRC